jgi:uncharacterized protein YjaG (DUF416 family)
MLHQDLTYKDFIETFKKQVIVLSTQKGLDLATAISKELFPDYQDFSEKHNWGDPRLLLEGIKLCEESKTRVLEKSDIDSVITRLDMIIPDTEDFGDYDGSYALNAGAAIHCALLYTIEKSPKYLFEIGTLYTDTTDFKLHQMNVAQKEIDSHPLMQAARRKLILLST